MKPIFCAFIFLSSLLMMTSCSEQSKLTRAEAEDQQLADNQIINIMMTIDKGEIAAAQEAKNKQASPAVNGYAKYLIDQHQRNLEELTQLAKQLGLEPKDSAISKTLSTDGENDLKKLHKLQGKEFDKAFIDAMVKGHQGGLEVVDTKLLLQAKNPQLKSFVEQFRKMVSNHLEEGLKIQQTL